MKMLGSAQVDILDRASLVSYPEIPDPDLGLHNPDQDLPPPPFDLPPPPPPPLENEPHDKNRNELQPLVFQNTPLRSIEEELGEDNLPSPPPKEMLLSAEFLKQVEGCRLTLGIQDLPPYPLPNIPDPPMCTNPTSKMKEPPPLPPKKIQEPPTKKDTKKTTDKVRTKSEKELLPYPLRELPPIPTEEPDHKPLSSINSVTKTQNPQESIDDRVQDQRFLPKTAHVTCKACHSTMNTTTERKVGVRTHLVALLLCMLLCWPCCLYPYLTDKFKDTRHYCSCCGTYQGKHEFSIYKP